MKEGERLSTAIHFTTAVVLHINEKVTVVFITTLFSPEVEEVHTSIRQAATLR